MAAQGSVNPNNTRSRRVNHVVPFGKQSARERPGFMWVNSDNGGDAKHVSLAAKMSFIRLKSSQSQKAKQLQKVAACLPLHSAHDSLGSASNTILIHRPPSEENEQHPPVMYRNMQAGLFEAYPTLPRDINGNLNFYYHHCKYLKNSYLGKFDSM